jgi:hypothetical protein
MRSESVIQSGFCYPLSELVRAWDGALVHPRFADKRNPQDFVRARPDGRPLPYTRPEADDVFLGTNDVTPADLCERRRAHRGPRER